MGIYETRAVHSSLDAPDAAAGGELPHDEAQVVLHLGHLFLVAGDDVSVFGELPDEVFVVEIHVGVDERFHTVDFLHALEECPEAALPCLCVAHDVASASLPYLRHRLHIHYGQQRLHAGVGRVAEVHQLLEGAHRGREEMIHPDGDSLPAAFPEVALVGVVLQLAALRAFQIHELHSLVLRHFLPVDLSLIVRHVDAVDVAGRALQPQSEDTLLTGRCRHIRIGGRGERVVLRDEVVLRSGQKRCGEQSRYESLPDHSPTNFHTKFLLAAAGI